jgi:hypothetical protein
MASNWKHTNLIGYGGGIDIGYKFNKNLLSLGTSYGYGEKNRYKDFDNVDYTIKTTVVIPISEEWGTDLSADGRDNRTQNTDNARNFQVDLIYQRSLIKFNDKLSLNLGFGLFLGYVEHTFTFKNIRVFNVDGSVIVSGPVNFIPISEQNFYTAGANASLSLDIIKNHKTYTPYFEYGYGPNHSSYYTLGLRLSAPLVKN